MKNRVAYICGAKQRRNFSEYLNLTQNDTESQPAFSNSEGGRDEHCNRLMCFQRMNPNRNQSQQVLSCLTLKTKEKDFSKRRERLS
jgi:hypothetical protein